jgi:hypothetical protein
MGVAERIFIASVPIEVHAGSFDCVRLSPHYAQDDKLKASRGESGSDAITSMRSDPDPGVDQFLHDCGDFLYGVWMGQGPRGG